MSRFAHVLRPLSHTRLPRRHVVFDTEAATRKTAAGYVQRWALGYVVTIDTRPRKSGPKTTETGVLAPEDLWEVVDDFTAPNERTVCWCHNLGYDLRISRGLELLPRRGWRLQGIVLERTAAWASFERDGSTLLLVDLHSWLPAPLERIADDLGITPVPLPRRSGDPRKLMARCQSDARITAEAVLELLAWLEAENLGPFRPTGAGQSYSAWRRRFHHHRVLVHDDADALVAEREAMWTGRAEAWAHGDLEDGPFTEWDLAAAYCHIAAECELPNALVGRARVKTPAQLAKLAERHAVLARVSVNVAEPVVPAMNAGRMLWPVGRFDTTLWDPELSLLQWPNEVVAVHDVWLYRRAPILQDFATWVLAGLDGSRPVRSPLVRRALKHWSRTLVGRLGLRYRTWDAWGTADDYGAELGILLDLDAHTRTDYLQVGKDLMTLGELTEARSSTPQVTGWVMSEARRRLWTLIRTAGAGNVVYVDTDCLITDTIGSLRVMEAIVRREAFSLTLKHTWPRLTIHGPRNFHTAAGPRISGVPKAAVRNGPLDYDGEVWRSLKESMSRGELDHVVVQPRHFTIDTADPRRMHLPDGITTPYVLGGPDE